MAQFRPTCPLCYQEEGYVIPLDKKGDEYVCRRKPQTHVFVIGPDGYLRRKD